MSEPVFVGSDEQQRAQRRAWEQTITFCSQCRGIINAVIRGCPAICSDCYESERRAQRAARLGREKPQG